MTSSNLKASEEKEFSSANIPDISFRYPIFPGWGVLRIDETKLNACLIFLNVPKGLKFDEIPHISVAKEQSGITWTGKATNNPHGIPYLQVESFANAPGESQHHFFPWETDSSLNVMLSFSAAQQGFSPALFWKTLIDTFQKKP